MSDRQKLISRLLAERDFRADYIRAKLDVLIPAQLRALRLQSEKTQSELARDSGMKQARISAVETPGKVNFNLETLVRLAATFRVGLQVSFVSFNEMLEWENDYRQDRFYVRRLVDDTDFLQPRMEKIRIGGHVRRRRKLFPQPVLPVQVFRGGRANQPFRPQPEIQMKLPFEQSLAAPRAYVGVMQGPTSSYVNFPLPNIRTTGAQRYAA